MHDRRSLFLDIRAAFDSVDRYRSVFRNVCNDEANHFHGIPRKEVQIELEIIALSS